MKPSIKTIAEPRKASRRQRLRNWGKWLSIAGLILFLGVMLFTQWVAGKTDLQVAAQAVGLPIPSSPRDELIVMSVNCAHGRGEGAHQALTSKKTLRANCESIGSLLAEHKADIVSVQECDAPSWWSGNFDHAKLIARTAGTPHLVHALNVDGAGLQYGTAVLSRLQLSDAVTHTFRPTPPTFSKGVAIARISWPGDTAFEFDFVTVHLDFASGSARGNQVRELVEIVRKRAKPMIIAGDLNCDWREDGAVRQLTSALELDAFEPESDMVTFPFTGERLDWILVSKELEITAVEAIDARLSDHRPLRAVIRRSAQ
ncbi:MAG: endonuclease/exonuclease/phosphatase family protein, partial [Planctomycetaceae bacterium]